VAAEGVGEGGGGVRALQNLVQRKTPSVIGVTTVLCCSLKRNAELTPSNRSLRARNTAFKGLPNIITARMPPKMGTTRSSTTSFTPIMANTGYMS
jgi:hypothetical protein